ncbi:MAG: hypothetical protein EA341_08935 [Mongoliibacter sp.]|nr:MAG: hypothetical protein EA341_08935 [Mongoliibacter sp.]
MAVYNVQAAVITVSNRPGDIANFTSISDAINAAADGDIIYVSGSATSYGSFTLAKRLTLVGSGHNPDNDNGLVSQLGSVTLVTGSSGSEIIGFRIAGISWSNPSDVINNINLQRNNIGSIAINGNSKEWIIQENIINSISSSSGITFEENLIIRNNIITSSISNLRYSLFTNNVFTATFAGAFSTIQFNSFSNNIFFQNDLNSDFTNARIQNCTFNNNIFFGSSNPTSLPTINGNSGQDNIFANPQFVNVPNNTFDYNQDFNLQGSSPGINAGTDNTDIGLFGGAGYTVSGTPAIPEVTLFNILNPIVPQNGNLNVRIEGKANN